MRRLWSFQPVLGVSKPRCSGLLRLLLRAQVPRETHLPCEVLKAGNLDTGAANHGSINIQLRSKQVNNKKETRKTKQKKKNYRKKDIKDLKKNKKDKTNIIVSLLKTVRLRNRYLFLIFINIIFSQP